MYSLVASGCLLSVLLATCIAYPFKNNYHETQDNYDPKDVRNLDGIGGGNLLRDLDILRNRAALYERQARNFDNLDSLQGITLGSQKRSWDPFTANGKRSMDEIDHAGFDSFVKKRGFDEIDNVGFDGFVKRNLDEIDRVGFGTFIKRNAPAYPTPVPHK